VAEVPDGLPFPLWFVCGDVLELWAASRASGARGLCVDHLLDGVEITAKFLASAGVGALGLVDGRVRDAVRGLGARPSLDRWLKVLGGLRKGLAASSSVLSQSLATATGAVLELADSDVWNLRQGPWKGEGVRGLRNWRAHAGVLGESQAEEVANRAIPAFLNAMAAVGRALASAHLVRVDGTGRGVEVPSGGGSDGVILDLSIGEQFQGLTGAAPGLYLGLEGEWAQVWPIVRHEPLGVEPGGLDPIDEAARFVHQVFVRVEGDAMQYVPLDRESVCGLGGSAETVAYRQWMSADAGRRGAFWAEVEELAAIRIGRDAELERLIDALDSARRSLSQAAPSASLSLLGAVGQGKSVLAAAVALAERDRAGGQVLVHIFKAGDAGCSLAAFIERALEELPELAHEPAPPWSPQERRRVLAGRLRAHRPAVVCDGVDELERAESGAVSKLRELSGSGGVWLFSGRPEEAVLSALGKARKIFPDGLPNMSPRDLRAMLLTHAAPVVRDAIALRDEPGDDGVLSRDAPASNPYVEALIEKAQGSPLYLALTLESLARKPTPAAVKEEIAIAGVAPGRLPKGIGELYQQLLQDWGTGDIATVKTPLLCYLAHAREPLGAAALAELIFSVPPTDDNQRERRVKLCHKALRIFMALLRGDRDRDGQHGYRPHHDSLREHLSTSQSHTEIWADTQARLAQLATRPTKVHDLQLRRHLYRHGIPYLLRDNRVTHAHQLLTSFDYLYDRLNELQATDIDDLTSTYSQIKAGSNPEFDEWRTFFRQHTHLLHRADRHWGPERILHQLAYEHGIQTSVTAAAEDWSRAHHFPPLHLDRRPIHPIKNLALDATLEGHVSAVVGLLLLPDGRLASYGSDGSVRVWDTDRGAQLQALSGHTDWVNGVVALSDSRLASYSDDGSIRIWDPDTGTQLRVLEGHTAAVTGLVVLVDGRLGSSSYDGSVRIWDPDSGAQFELESHKGTGFGLFALSDGRLLSWSRGGAVRIGDPDGGARPLVLEGQPSEIGGMVVLSDDRLVSWTGGSPIRIWDPGSGELMREIDGGMAAAVDRVVALPNGRLASCPQVGETRVWDPDGGAPSVVLQGGFDWVKGVLELSDGRLAGWAQDGSVLVWDPDTGAVLRVLDGHAYGVNDLVQLMDGRLASCSADGSVRVWNPDNAVQPTQFGGDANGADGPVELPGASPAPVFIDGSGWLSAPGGLENLDLLEGHTDWPGSRDYLSAGEEVVLPDGRRASCSKQGDIRVWAPDGDAEDVVLTDRADEERDPFDLRQWDLVPLPDGRLASWCSEGSVRVWHPDDRAPRLVLEGHTRWVMGLIALSDGRLVSWSTDGSIRLWDPGSGAQLRVLEGHTDEVINLVVLAGGYLASCSADGSLRVWDPDSGAQLHVLEGHRDVSDLVVLPDGRLVSWSLDSVRILAVGDELSLVARAVYDSSVPSRFLVTSSGIAGVGWERGRRLFLLRIRDQTPEADSVPGVNLEAR
jgi:WD40 repeat protein